MSQSVSPSAEGIFFAHFNRLTACTYNFKYCHFFIQSSFEKMAGFAYCPHPMQRYHFEITGTSLKIDLPQPGNV
jgi:hypothetical protein